MMPFESAGNQMRGSYNYTDLETRLRKIREAIDEETQSWIVKGAKAYEVHDRVASNLKFQFDQCQGHFATNPNGSTITLEMEKDNPFIWTVVLPTPRQERS
jgi:ubiquitin-conjugating enzyme E2 Z